MYTLYKFHFLNGISEINQLFDDILIIWPAPVYIYTPSNQYMIIKLYIKYDIFLIFSINKILILFYYCY